MMMFFAVNKLSQIILSANLKANQWLEFLLLNCHQLNSVFIPNNRHGPPSLPPPPLLPPPYFPGLSYDSVQWIIFSPNYCRSIPILKTLLHTWTSATDAAATVPESFRHPLSLHLPLSPSILPPLSLHSPLSPIASRRKNACFPRAIDLTFMSDAITLWAIWQTAYPIRLWRGLRRDHGCPSIGPIGRPITAAAGKEGRRRRPLISPLLTRLPWPLSRLMASLLPLPTLGDLRSAKVHVFAFNVFDIQGFLSDSCVIIWSEFLIGIRMRRKHFQIQVSLVFCWHCLQQS